MAPPQQYSSRGDLNASSDPTTRENISTNAITANDLGADVHFSSVSIIMSTIYRGVILALVVLTAGISICFVYRGPVFALGVALCTALIALIFFSLFITVRHICLVQKRKAAKANLEAGIMSGKKDSAPDLANRSAVSYLYVLGSGGHTTEMMALIKLSFKANTNQHRRYITTSGDQHSLNQKSTLENIIQTKYPNGTAGTHDTVTVTRARSVYQSYFTSVATSLRCALDILVALTEIPSQRIGQHNSEDFRYPHVIVTNGPGTGFIVGIMAHILKLLCLAPKDRLKIVFVETWARTHKLGLTGRLFYHTDIADLFLVQSQTLSKVVHKPAIGNVNKRYAEVGRVAAVMLNRN